jgi:hypothetical protein
MSTSISGSIPNTRELSVAGFCSIADPVPVAVAGPGAAEEEGTGEVPDVTPGVTGEGARGKEVDADADVDVDVDIEFDIVAAAGEVTLVLEPEE